jgi:hypothetical protein
MQELLGAAISCSSGAGLQHGMVVSPVASHHHVLATRAKAPCCLDGRLGPQQLADLLLGHLLRWGRLTDSVSSLTASSAGDSSCRCQRC